MHFCLKDDCNFTQIWLDLTKLQLCSQSFAIFATNTSVFNLLMTFFAQNKAVLAPNSTEFLPNMTAFTPKHNFSKHRPSGPMLSKS
jgi:hypothetical protein